MLYKYELICPCITSKDMLYKYELICPCITSEDIYVNKIILIIITKEFRGKIVIITIKDIRSIVI